MLARRTAWLVIVCAYAMARSTGSAAQTGVIDDELIARSSLIVTGSVREIRETSITIDVFDVLKGSASQRQILIRRGDDAPNAAHFARGESVLLLLEEDARDRTFRVTEGRNGKWTLARDATWHQPIA